MRRKPPLFGMHMIWIRTVSAILIWYQYHSVILNSISNSGSLDREELRKLYIDLHKESVEKIKGELWETQKIMIFPCNLFCW
jgi:hypothetical protein